MPRLRSKTTCGDSAATWRDIGHETTSGCGTGESDGRKAWAPPVDVENLTELAVRGGFRKSRAHASVFLVWGRRQNAYIAECEGKLERRRSELAAGRTQKCRRGRLRRPLATPTLAAERQRRAEENREQLKKLDRQRADFRAQLDRNMASGKD